MATKSIWETLTTSMRDISKDVLEYLPMLVAGIVVFFITLLLIKLFRSVIKRALARSRMRKSLRDLILRLASILLWTVGLMATAMVVFPGLTPTKALSALGIASIAIGLAFKDIFENFFAGILLLWKFPFEEGDFIECEDLIGRVKSIDIRMTTLEKVSGELVVVPNAFLFKNPVDVLTHNPKRRVTLMTGIAYDETVEDAVPIIKQAIAACASVDDEHYDIEVFPKEFGSSSIDIETTWWTDPTPKQVRSSRAEVVTAIKRALDDANIEIPYPYRTLIMRNEA